MKNKSLMLIVLSLLFMTTTSLLFSQNVLAAQCAQTYVLAYPAWYNGLECIGTSPVITDLQQIWIIVMNIIQWLIVTVGFAAVLFIMIGGFNYMTAKGEPSKIAEAKSSIAHAIVGLVIALSAVMIVRTIQAGIVEGKII